MPKVKKPPIDRVAVDINANGFTVKVFRCGEVVSERSQQRKSRGIFSGDRKGWIEDDLPRDEVHEELCDSISELSYTGVCQALRKIEEESASCEA